MKRAAVYLRVSTVAQAKRGMEPEGYSIPAQREACERKAAELEAEIADEYVDRGESARSARRPKLQELLARLKTAGDIDFVIVHKLDRLARNLADHVEITLAIRAAGADLVSVTESIDDTPLGEYMSTIFAANAQLYSANLSAEAKKGLHQKAKLGGTPGRAPLGYLNVREVIDGREVRTVRIDPDRAPHVRWAFAAYASGAYTLDTLCEALTKRGLTARATPKKPPAAIHRTTLAWFLQNPYYVGTVRYGGVEYEGRHEQLIDKSTFSRVQAVFTAHSNAQERDRKHHHFLKGSLYCGRCGSRMTFVKAKGNGGTYPYFACIARIRGTGCRQPYLPAETAEREVQRRYALVNFTGDNEGWQAHLDGIREELDEVLGGMATENERQLRAQRLRLSKLDREREKLLHAHYGGAVPLDLLKREQERIAREREGAERQIALVSESVTEVGEIVAMALDLLQNCAEAYAAAPSHLQRQWNQALFERFDVDDDQIAEAPLREPFATFATPSGAEPVRRTPPKSARSRTRRQRGSANRQGHAFSGPGSNKEVLVGATGFEPATARPPAECATRLRHAPWLGPEFTTWWRSISGRKRERVTGLEPVPPAWKAGVQPVTPHPQRPRG